MVLKQHLSGNTLLVISYECTLSDGARRPTGIPPRHFQGSPGFETLGMAEVDKTAFVSVSAWKTREQADAATTKAAEWVKANSRDQFALRHNYIGDLTIDTDAREPATSLR